MRFAAIVDADTEDRPDLDVMAVIAAAGHQVSVVSTAAHTIPGCADVVVSDPDDRADVLRWARHLCDGVVVDRPSTLQLFGSPAGSEVNGHGGRTALLTEIASEPHPSQCEPHGLAPADADLRWAAAQLAAGTALVVDIANRALAELVEHHRCGFVVASVAELNMALALVETEPFAHRLSERARAAGRQVTAQLAAVQLVELLGSRPSEDQPDATVVIDDTRQTTILMPVDDPADLALVGRAAGGLDRSDDVTLLVWMSPNTAAQVDQQDLLNQCSGGQPPGHEPDVLVVVEPCTDATVVELARRSQAVLSDRTRWRALASLAGLAMFDLRATES